VEVLCTGLGYTVPYHPRHAAVKGDDDTARSLGEEISSFSVLSYCTWVKYCCMGTVCAGAWRNPSSSSTAGIIPYGTVSACRCYLSF
jgi:hypothetical protein